ncbi:MAG: TolC family outer membrane protein [Rhodospirillales bacterium]|nr:TolC family outer membrane protein [Rhodospirillales bacterium]
MLGKKIKYLALSASCAALMAVSATALAQGAENYQQINLRDAVAVGLALNPEYGVVANNRRATDEELNQAKSLYLPSVDLRADTGYEHSDDPATRAGVGNDEENMWRYEAGLTLTQLLFDGFETKYENLRQQARVLSASNRVREASELVGLAIVEAYLEVMRQRELLKIARDNVAEHVSLMQQIDESASAGRTTQADVEQARARVASARAQEASVRESLRFAEASYIREVGEQPKDLIMPMVPVDGLSGSVDEEVKMALHQSPTIDIFEADIQVAHAEFEGTKSTFYPQVDLQLNARQGEDINGVEGRDTSASALVVLNWNLYRGGGDTARVREHISREAQAKEERSKAARGIENDVRQTWARMISAGERAREFASQADANTEVVKAYKDQFDLNRRTLLDVLDAQNELFVSRSNTVNSEYLEIFAVYRLLALKGELLAALGVDYPRESNPAIM